MPLQDLKNENWPSMMLPEMLNEPHDHMQCTAPLSPPHIGHMVPAIKESRSPFAVPSTVRYFLSPSALQ